MENARYLDPEAILDTINHLEPNKADGDNDSNTIGQEQALHLLAILPDEYRELVEKQVRYIEDSVEENLDMTDGDTYAIKKLELRGIIARSAIAGTALALFFAAKKLYDTHNSDSA